MTAKTRRIMLQNTFAQDPRWIDAGAEAFALHVAACCHADQANTDGRIDRRILARICYALPADRVAPAAAALVDNGFWTEDNSDYKIVNYLEDQVGIPADEQEATRARWAEDKKRERHHGNGVHDLCDPRKCAYLKAANVRPGHLPESGPESGRRPGDYTLPDSTLRERRVGGAAKARPASGADAPTAVEPRREKIGDGGPFELVPPIVMPDGRIIFGGKK